MNEGENMNVLLGQASTAPVLDGRTQISLTTPLANFGVGLLPAQRVPFTGLLSNKILAGLPGPDFSRMLPFLEPVSLAGRQQLNRYGERIDFVYFPETAVISHVYFLADGSTAAASVVGKDGAVGLSAVFDAAPPAYWIEVTLPGTALRVPVDIVQREFRDGGSLHRLLLDCLSARLAQVSRKAVCNGCHELPKRLCTWLLMIHDRANANDLPLTQELMANHLGTRRATVNATCTTLREEGIINYRRGVVSVIDRKKLESVACECYRPA